MADLLIKGGVVIDGTGSPGLASDIRVRDGRTVEIGPNLSRGSERVIDAAGAVVTPGFIDSHTHFDATIYWDPMCDPMPQHGITTIVAGNCSLGLAPIRPGDRALQMDCFSYIEDIPLDILNSAIPWSWETFGDYAKALSERRLGLNLLTFVGHTQIRAFVMGEASWERAATADEIKEMAAVLDRALAAGALGMSFTLFDRDRKGRWVPSVLADDAELDAMCAVLAKHGASFQFVPTGDSAEKIIEQLERLGRHLGKHGVIGLYNIVVHVGGDPTRSVKLLACLEKLQREGVKLYGMVSPRSFDLSVAFHETICFIEAPAWNELVQAKPGDKAAMLKDPAWRARARTDADNSPSVMFPFKQPELLRINTAKDPKGQEWIGRTLGELVKARGGHVSDVLADWAQENDCDATFVYPIANTDYDAVAALLKNPVTFVSGSDAGAHLQMFCAAGDCTLLLTRYVRERKDLTLEAAVHSMTGRQAALLGLPDRGVLAPGKVADIAIFALDELDYGAEFTVNDLPGGLPRRSRKPGGYRYTIVNGAVVQEGGKATGELSGCWLPVVR